MALPQSSPPASRRAVRRASEEARGMQRSYDPGPSWRPVRLVRRWYITVGQKFAISLAFAACWTAFSVWLSLSWLDDLAHVISIVPAVIVITFLAYIPGFIVALLTASLLLDRQPAFKVLHPEHPITVMIAAYNEEASIAETLSYLAEQDYDGPLEVMLIDNASTDGTVRVAEAFADKTGLELRVVREATPGKNHALNHGLAQVTTDLVVTVDADTLLHRSALRLLVCRLVSSPRDVNAVAGSVLVRNGRDGMWARLQEWDYFLGIASVKRMQGLFQTTLVAQGAFSLYRTEAVRKVGGWPDAIGEDIVLTWQLMRQGARVYYEPLAVAFTAAPVKGRHLARQRARWARGMLEGLRTVPPWTQQHGLAKILTALDLVIPFLDGAYVFLWIPGLVLACFGIFWIIGPMTAAVIPLTLAVYTILYRYQRRQVFQPLGLRVRRNLMGFVLFVVFYQFFMSTVSVVGYTQHLTNRQRRWK
jgi:biofilm PGA synthesis N-glycosyltransferase PgaC